MTEWMQLLVETLHYNTDPVERQSAVTAMM